MGVLHYWWLVPVGAALGLFGTLIGVGGGFLLVPLLLLLYPHDSPVIITSISLAVVFFNAGSGSLAYGRMGRIDYRSAFLFSLATIPGAVFGALTTASIPRRTFDLVLGVLMLAAAVYLLLQPHADADETTAPSADADGANGTTVAAAKASGFRPRTRLGIVLSGGVGYVSGLLGIGGGIIHVPLLVRVLRFPVHIATATSHMILTGIALAGTIVHVWTGDFSQGYWRTIFLAIGVVVGAQLGAELSNRLRGAWIVRLLAVALGFVGVRVLLLAFTPHMG